LAANSPDTFSIAGRLGTPIFASPLINPPDKLREYLTVHREALQPGLDQDVALMFPIHVSDSREQARQECEASLIHFFKAAGERLKPLGNAAIKSFEAFQQVLERLERVNYDGVDKRMGVFGDPAHCIERIKALQEEFQMDEFIGYFNQGGLVEPATVRRSMELFTKEVIPHCQ
jgi:alkanesulfonate monooxygenase SsuD/methylene tetrahydromethanopterin reductase-like flavin-dependent oxidoreductase (luciferase family)